MDVNISNLSSHARHVTKVRSVNFRSCYVIRELTDLVFVPVGYARYYHTCNFDVNEFDCIDRNFHINSVVINLRNH